VPEAPRFTADAMLGRLARWLRALGYDTTYDPSIHDHELVARADAEGRTLLTRDRHLLRELRPARGVEIRSDVPLEQLKSVVDALALPPPDELFTRCLVCNTPLPPPLPEAEARALVPPKSRAIGGPVRRCPTCLRVYWPGSHARRMRAALAAALPAWKR
jgi:uncharacterized protein with PIN domain